MGRKGLKLAKVKVSNLLKRLILDIKIFTFPNLFQTEKQFLKSSCLIQIHFDLLPNMSNISKKHNYISYISIILKRKGHYL